MGSSIQRAQLRMFSGLALPAIIGIGMASVVPPGIAFYWGGMLGWLWLGATAVHLVKVG